MKNNDTNSKQEVVGYKIPTGRKPQKDKLMDVDELWSRMKTFFEKNPVIGKALHDYVYSDIDRKQKATPKLGDKEKLQLRAEAFKLYDAGASCEEVGKQLGVRKMTVAAWVAHRTMGTYNS